MPTIRMKVTTNWCGAEDEEEIELTEEELEDIEQTVEEWANDMVGISWEWEEVEED